MTTRRNIRLGEDPVAYMQEQFGGPVISDFDPNNWTPEQSANMLDAIHYGAYGAGNEGIQNGDLSAIRDVAQNGLAPVQGPGQYNQFEGGYTDESGQYHLGPSQWEHDSAWAGTTNYDELTGAGNYEDARTWVKQQYISGNLTAEEAQALENQAFESQYGSLSHTYEVHNWGDGNTLSSKGYVTNTITPTDYSTLSQDPAGWSRGTNQHNVDRVTTQDLGGQIFKTIASTALTMGAGAALAPALSGLSAAASGAIKGGLGGAISGAVNGEGLDLEGIATGALTGGLGGSLSNPNGMLGGYINTGSELADDAIKGALVGGVGGAIKGDALGGALMGAGGGVVTNLAGQGMDYLSGDDSSEWDFVSGPEWDESDLMNQDLALDLLQPIDVTAVRRRLPEWAQDQADSDAFYEQYGNPQSFDGGYSDRFDAEYDAAVQDQLDSDAFDYINSDEFVGPSAGLAAGYDPNTMEGQWLDNLTQEDVIHSNLTFENSALSGYIDDDRAFSIIKVPDKVGVEGSSSGYYLIDNNGNMVKYRGGDIGRVDLAGNNTQGTAMYDSLDPLSQHIAAGGQLPGTGQRYVDIDLDQTETDPQETEVPEDTQTDNTEDSAESTPTNSTDKTEMGGESDAGSDGNPSQDTGLSNPTIPSDYVLVGVDSNGERIYENVITNIRIPESDLPGEVYASNPQGDPDSSNEPTANPDEGATGTAEDAEDGGGQNADTDGGGGTNSGTDAGDGDSDGNDLGETGDNDGIGDDDDPGKGADDEGAGDPGIGSGSGGNGLGDGLGLLAGLGGGGSDENYRWQPIAGLTKLSPYQKRRHTIYNSLNEGLLKAALQQGRRA